MYYVPGIYIYPTAVFLYVTGYAKTEHFARGMKIAFLE